MLTVGQVIDRVRDEYPDATEQVLIEPSLARHLSAYQRELQQQAVLLRPDHKAQQASIIFDPAGENEPTRVGRGSTGGLPVVAGTDGNYLVVRGQSGNLIEYDLDSAARIVEPRPVYAASPNWLNTEGVLWVEEALVDRLVRIVSGKGANTTPRLISYNNNNEIVVSQDWEIEPDETSMFEVLEAPPEVTAAFGVATSTDPTKERVGYLVREDASGLPYIDHTRPLRATFSTGIPLPPHLKVLGGTVRYAPQGGQATRSIPLALAAYNGRAQDMGLPTAYVLNTELYLAEHGRHWQQATSIDLRYTPIPPAVFFNDDAFLLDDAEAPLVARAVLWTHRRAKALGITSADVEDARAEFSDKETKYLASLSLSRPATAFKRRDTFSRRY